jgi:hypothetical protein
MLIFKKVQGMMESILLKIKWFTKSNISITPGKTQILRAKLVALVSTSL